VTPAVVVLSTAGSQDEAERIATALVDERLAACVNLVAPLTSIYRWHGAVERAAEVLLVIKTRKRLVPRLIRRLEALHSYEVPEAIVLPIAAGARRYLAWLLGETATSATRTRPRSGSHRRLGG
jgi:periplasmic divalent cation tolerance protein